jgi:hypothetical protein
MHTTLQVTRRRYEPRAMASSADRRRSNRRKPDSYVRQFAPPTSSCLGNTASGLRSLMASQSSVRNRSHRLGVGAPAVYAKGRTRDLGACRVGAPSPTSHHSPVPRRGHDRQKADAASCAKRSGVVLPPRWGRARRGLVPQRPPHPYARPHHYVTARSFAAGDLPIEGFKTAEGSGPRPQFVFRD